MSLKNLNNEKYENLLVYYGPMYSGKTDKLIKKIKEAKILGKSLLIFKSNIDNRTEEIYSRTGEYTFAISIKNSHEIITNLEKNNWKIDIIFIDELQFFDEEIVNVIKTILNNGVEVIVSGLDTDYKTDYFYNTNEIINLAIPKNRIHLFARCSICNKKAAWSAKKINGKFSKNDDSIIEVEHFGDSKLEYLPLCDRHHPSLNQG